MFDKLSQELMRHVIKLMSNPRVMKMMADPRFMNAISQGFALKGKIQEEIECKLRQVAESLNLVTREEVECLKRDLRDVEESVSHLERKEGE